MSDTTDRLTITDGPDCWIFVRAEEDDEAWVLTEHNGELRDESTRTHWEDVLLNHVAAARREFETVQAEARLRGETIDAPEWYVAHDCARGKTVPYAAILCSACLPSSNPNQYTARQLTDEILRLRDTVQRQALDLLTAEGLVHKAESYAEELTRLRDEARGVRTVEAWVRSSAMNRVLVDSFNNMGAFVYGEDKVASTPTLAALGLELLKQGRVTL